MAFVWLKINCVSSWEEESGSVRSENLEYTVVELVELERDLAYMTQPQIG